MEVEGEMLDRYKLDEFLGDGSFGTVYSAKDINQGKSVAIKKIPMTDGIEIPLNVCREAAILYDMEHQNIVRLERVFVHDGSLYLVMEHVAMNLSVHIGWYEEKYPGIVKDFVKQTLTGVAYIHSLGVIHRDIKPENLLVDTRTSTIKIADFGSARGFITPDVSLTPQVVTLWYRAPEMLKGSNTYTTAVDIWAIGCVFAELVLLDRESDSEPFFQGDSEIDVLGNIDRIIGDTQEGNELASTFKSRLDPAGVDLLSRMLSYDPAQRISANEALQHPYFN